ncbi:hypothetical protein JTE90_023916 [Oedothorax gibbosus]|uniref:AAA+ ATPase domain-containing protein n=1 Tax=Oedothorax gibbosus TaxID=931172 RepID=A0AAV6UNM8_9ARAC|nr:hypothetical protein JTE90_023916 [Oedothorax gibbosus]
MTHLNIEKISLACRDREREEQKKNQRKKTILVLIQNYLETNGMFQTSETLKNESRFCVDDYSACDNIDLESILQDFESYYFLKYQKLPHFVKKVSPDLTLQCNVIKDNQQKNKRITKSAPSVRKTPTEAINSNMLVTQLSLKSNNNDNLFTNENETPLSIPLTRFDSFNCEWKSMAQLIMQDCNKTDKPVHWCEVIGHGRAKQLLQEAVVYPIKYKEIINCKTFLWRSLLLYGPTGTGKTLLAHATATESKAAFFKVCVSTLVSKWRGESEKLIKVLFDLAKHHSPSIIFIDEIDALLSHRNGDHEASRRLKTEFFLQMDSLSESNKFVVLIGASNMPWELDPAVLRRLEKRVLINLPDQDSRVSLFRKFLPESIHISDGLKISTDLDYDELGMISKKYSASDISLVCKEAKMTVVRKVIQGLETNNQISTKRFTVEPLSTSDVIAAVDNIKPAASELVEKYSNWKKDHGSE